MRVLFWAETFWPQIGGVEVLAARFLPALQARGYEYAVVASKVSPDMPDEATFNGVPVYRFLFWNNLSHDGMEHVSDTRQRLMKLKRSFAPSLIHLNHVGLTSFFHLVTSTAHSCPALVTLHGEWPDKANAIVERTLRAADWVVGCSAAILDKGRRLTPEIVSRSSLILNGIEEPRITPAPLPFDPPCLLCLGRLAPEKGFDVAIAAFAAVIRQFPRARLIIAGDGPARAALEAQADTLHTRDRVEFVGWVHPDRVPELINASTLLIMPSRLESLPLVALQAGMLGRPIVGTSAGGIPEVVVDQVTGLLVAQEDSAGLAEAISFLLARPPTAADMGQAARSRVKESFDWDRHIDAYDALYRELIKS